MLGREVDELDDELVAGTCGLEAVLVVCEIEASIVGDGEIEVVREDLAEEDHRVDALGPYARGIGRVARLPAYTGPSLPKPKTMVVSLEPLANPGDAFRREHACGIVNRQAGAVGRHLAVDARSVNLETAVVKRSGAADSFWPAPYPRI